MEVINGEFSKIPNKKYFTIINFKSPKSDHNPRLFDIHKNNKYLYRMINNLLLLNNNII